MCATPTTTTTTIAVTTAQVDGIDLELVNGCFDERELRPLPRHVLAALSLTADEQRNSDVFVLNGYQHPEHTQAGQCVPRLAVCRPVPHLEWGQLVAGCAVIYTEAYSFTEEERPLSHIPSLCSHVGAVRLSDDERELIYTSTWEGGEDQDRSHEYGEVYEIWQVQRFIEIAHAKPTL
jgi:hypothetical protein